MSAECLKSATEMAGRAKALFKKYPLISNSIIYGTMCVSAEFSQQTINRKYFSKKTSPEPYDTNALLRYAIIGSFVNSNILYFWYKWLDRSFVGRGGGVIVKKLLLDQFVLTPPLLMVFYISMSVMEGKLNIIEECRNKFLPTFQTSCSFWLPAQTINFLLIPPAARVVYVGSCSFLWVNILCWFKRKQYHSTETKEILQPTVT